jgi:hypothetical protein
MIGWWLDLQLPKQSVLMTSNVVSSNPANGDVYSIENYMIKFVSDLRQVGGFLRVTPVSLANKTDRHDIIKSLLKVALNTITLIPNPNIDDLELLLTVNAFNLLCFVLLIAKMHILETLNCILRVYYVVYLRIECIFL